MKGLLSINLYLLQKGVDPLQEINLRDFRRAFSVPVSRADRSILYYKVSGDEPEWLKSLKQLAGNVDDIGRSASPQALLFVRWKQRWFVLTFGHAWQRVANARIEPDFGTRCVLNIARPDSLVSIRRDRVADSSIQAIEQIPDTDDIHRFGMDVEQDMLRGVKAKIDESFGFGAFVVGGDSFKGTIDFSNDSILKFCRRLLRFYGMSAVSKNFSWFNKIKPVSDAIVISKLEDRLARALSLGVRSITLTIPEFLAWDQYDTFSFAKQKRGHAPVSEPLDPVHWRRAHVADRVTSALVNSSFIYAYKLGRSDLVTKWPFRKCINSTIRLGAVTYVTQSGKWYRVHGDFIEEVGAAVAAIPKDNIYFPKVRAGETEGNYNTRMGSDFASRFFYLDKKLVHVTGRSNIEACDLLRFDGGLVCVKPWGGKSQHLSHLFQQAIVAGQLIASHPPYIIGVSNVINRPGFNAIWGRESAKPSGAVIVLAIIRGVPKEKLPFFAQVALINCARTLTQMRYEVRYTTIN